MYYEINIGKLNPKTGRYEHFFATAERSCTNLWSFNKVLADIKEKYLEPEFRITATRCERVSKPIDITYEKED